MHQESPSLVVELWDVSVMFFENDMLPQENSDSCYCGAPIAQNWRSLICCEPIPQAAHSLQPKLAAAKRFWNLDSSQIGYKIDMHETS